MATQTIENSYKYEFSGKEWNNELGYNMYDFNFRHYDPAIARWVTIDPLSDQMRRYSPYTYAFDNPAKFIDPDGMAPFSNNCCGFGVTMVGLGNIFGNFKRMATNMSNGDGVAVAYAKAVRDNPILENVVDEVPVLGEAADISRGDYLSVGIGLIPGGKKVKKVVEALSDTKKASKKAKKTFQTYNKKAKNPKKDGDYSGRTSGTDTPRKNVENRDKNHHKNDTHGPATLDKSSANKDAIRGREQTNIDANGGAKSKGGTSGNAIQGIGNKNKKKQQYLNAAKKEFDN